MSPLLSDDPPGAGPELRRELMRLRFASSSLELAFRKAYDRDARTSRMILAALGGLLVAATPLYDRWLLQPPEAFIEFSRWMQFGVQVPAAVLALLFAWHGRLQRWSTPVTIATVLIMAAGLSAQVVAGAHAGFNVPDDFPALALAAAFMLGQLRVLQFLPWAAGTLAVTTAVQLHVADVSPGAIYNAISTWMLLALAVAGAYLLELSARRNWLQSRQLATEAARDPLTGLPNRRHFDATLLRLVRQAAREKKSVALMILDVDDFKAFNDRYGHPAGDECLRLVSRSMSQAMRRPQDFCARIGGEEFAAVWFDAQATAAPALAEDLRAGIRQLAITHAGSSTGRTVTASAGFVQVFAPKPEAASAQIAADMIDRADEALYEAKRNGRDRLVDANDPPSPITLQI